MWKFERDSGPPLPINRLTEYFSQGEQTPAWSAGLVVPQSNADSKVIPHSAASVVGDITDLAACNKYDQIPCRVRACINDLAESSKSQVVGNLGKQLGAILSEPQLTEVLRVARTEDWQSSFHNQQLLARMLETRWSRRISSYDLAQSAVRLFSKGPDTLSGASAGILVAVSAISLGRSGLIVKTAIENDAARVFRGIASLYDPVGRLTAPGFDLDKHPCLALAEIAARHCDSDIRRAHRVRLLTPSKPTMGQVLLGLLDSEMPDRPRWLQEFTEYACKDAARHQECNKQQISRMLQTLDRMCSIPG